MINCGICLNATTELICETLKNLGESVQILYKIIQNFQPKKSKEYINNQPWKPVFGEYQKVNNYNKNTEYIVVSRLNSDI